MQVSGRAFLILLGILAVLAIATQPAVLTAVLPATPTPAGTPTFTPAPTATPTLDPLAAIPVATTVGQAVAAYPLPTLPPATAVPAAAVDILAPTPLPVTPAVLTPAVVIPPAPTPVGVPPDRIVIPRLNLDAAVEPSGMVPSTTVPGVAEWAIPDHRAAGWLNTSAPFARPGNTVLAGHHNIHGEVFRGLWDLAAGDEIVLYAGQQVRRYRVSQVLVVAERDRPLAERLANAPYIQPTGDERLTLVTCWPYESNTHRTIVIAYPER